MEAVCEFYANLHRISASHRHLQAQYKTRPTSVEKQPKIENYCEVSIETAAFSTEKSTKKAAISIEIRSNRTSAQLVFSNSAPSLDIRCRTFYIIKESL